MPRFLLNLALALGLLAAGPAAWAQPCQINPPPATCPQPIRAVDVATGQPVDALCVGRAVRFEPNPACGRVIDPTRLFYNALPGTNTLPAGCDFRPGQLAGNTFTPTTAGPYSIVELSYAVVAGVPSPDGNIYVRNMEAKAAPPPRVAPLAPCLNNQALVTVTGGDGYDQYEVRVDNTLATTLSGAGGSVTIAVPLGSSTILVRGVYAGNALCRGESSQPVTRLATPVAPTLARLTTGGPLPGSVSLALAGLQAGYVYEVQAASPGAPPGSYAVVGTVPAGSTGSTTLSLAGAAAGTYRLRQRDACQTEANVTPPVPTLELSGTSANNQNLLRWQAGGPVGGYSLLRDGRTLATPPAGATSYEDRDVTCGERHTYQLQATVPGGSLSVSNDVTVQTVSALAPATPQLLASFDLRNRLTLSSTLPGGAPLPAGSAVRYSRQGGPGNLDFDPVPAALDTLRDPAALDVLLASPPCYTAALQDVCGNRSAASAPVCPSLLTAAPADPDGRTVRLSWTAFRGPGGAAAGVSYRVLSLNAAGAVVSSAGPTAGLTYLDGSPPASQQVVRYRIEVSGGGLPAGQVSYSNVAAVTRRPVLAVPNAFTPNGDGLNDVLGLKGRYLAAFTFVVVDRNGQEVFRATDLGQTWDGTIRGHAPVNAAYVWRFTMTDETGQPFTQTGSVSILK